jgi:hypothetical protein
MAEYRPYAVVVTNVEDLDHATTTLSPDIGAEPLQYRPCFVRAAAFLAGKQPCTKPGLDSGSDAAEKQ